MTILFVSTCPYISVHNVSLISIFPIVLILVIIQFKCFIFINSKSCGPSVYLSFLLFCRVQLFYFLTCLLPFFSRNYCFIGFCKTFQLKSFVKLLFLNCFNSCFCVLFTIFDELISRVQFNNNSHFLTYFGILIHKKTQGNLSS